MPQVQPPAVEPVKGLTNKQKIIAVMCQHPEKKWWLASDFMKPDMKDLFVCYEATARLSELTGDYPDAFETERQGKFRAVRMRFETGKEWYGKLTPKLQLMVKKYYNA